MPQPQDKRPPQGPGASPPPPKGRGLLFWFIMLAAIVLFATMLQRGFGPEAKTITTNEFYDCLYQGKIAKIVLDGNHVRGQLALGKSAEGKPEQFTLTIRGEQIRDLDRRINDYNREVQEGKVKGKSVAYETETGGEMFRYILTNVVIWLVPMLLIFWLISRQMRSAGMGGGLLSFGKSRARLVSRERSRITFDDVAGVEEARDEVSEIVDFLKSPEKFRRLGGRIPRGVLLIGPPGTGKTLLAKAIAGEANVPFFNISGSDFVEMFVGVGASRVRDLFRQAKESSPCIIFLDEIDAVGRRRGAGLGGGHDEREQTLNAILVEMDGFERDESVIVVAATNRPDVLDPALLRPGRFDRQISVDLPDIRGREAILKVHARKYKLADGVDLNTLARGTPTFSGADLEATLNEAALIATRKGKNAIEMDDLEEARDKVRWGRQKRSLVLDEEDRRITAIHESGHALVSLLLSEVDDPHKVTIVPQGMALGATMSLPDKDRYHVQRRRLLGQVAVLLAGRVAEEVACDDVSSGAQNDLERATEIVRSMVCRWGMSEELGPVSYHEGEDTVFLGREITRQRNHSEAIAVKIDEEIRHIILEQYARVRGIVRDHLDRIEAMAEALLKYEVLNSDDLKAILDGKVVTKEKPPVELVPAKARSTAPVPETRPSPGGTIRAPEPRPVEGSL